MRDMADLMVSLGLRDAGYQYLIIDGAWTRAPRCGLWTCGCHPMDRWTREAGCSTQRWSAALHEQHWGIAVRARVAGGPSADGWEAPQRAPDGRLVANPAKFPLG